MSTKSQGFTLVEVLVIAPVVILFIGIFISLLVNLTGESLVMREKNAAIYNSQATLDDIESSIAQATSFLATTGSVASPQGKENYDLMETASTTAFTNTGVNGHDALIIQAAVTNKSPNDSTRKLIYTGSGACDSKNPLYTYMIVYFVALDPDTADTADKALYKRTIVPSLAACDTPYQRNSCNPARRAAYPSICKASDEKLVSGISTFDISYYIGSNTAAESDSNAAQATDVSVNLGLAKQVAGSSITQGSSVRTNSVNVQAADSSGGSGGGGATTPPPNPAIQWSRTTTDPYRTTISWSRIGNATGYTAKYSIGGGSEQTANISQPAEGSTPSFLIDASHRKQTIQLTELKVLASSGDFIYGTPPAISAIPSWNECSFQNGWHNYKDWYGGNTFTTGGFTKTSSKLVGLKGLVRGGTVGQTICTLPVGFRPKFAGEKLIFQVTTASGNTGRVDVLAGGEIVAVSGGNDWFSLDGIIFAADDSTYTWTNRSWQSGWTQYPSGHATLRSTTDSQGRIHVQGLGSYPGTSPNSIAMTSGLPASTNTLHYPAMAGGPGIVQILTNGVIQTRSSPNSYQQLQMIYRPSGSTGWQNMPFSSGWTNYLNGFPTMQCHRGSDDVVIVQGLIRHPGGGNGTYIGDTGPCGRFSSGQGIGQADRLILSPWMSNETTGRIDFINGVSLLSSSTQDPWTALDGIHFIAD